ncbi:Catabolite control protein A [Lacunisphaera limnophila]|uniref:Catabolite control protein A n=1 Tax=Lacunisphaera limnophila TaxID=1838286 RepID=A0A1D8AV88_9BACT|nr:LacI family DNA-binding transcriptional regulator [Lacunisphaera limnophila]AOS44791.1 Catabolite control protein A [Lacunisphaera limnophila]
MDAKRVTQQDIARKAGVHRATVSMALQGHPNIPPATRDRILGIAASLGYTPDPMLSALAAYRNRRRPAIYHGTLAWLINSAYGFDWRDRTLRPHFSDYHEGATAQAKRYGFQVEIFDFNAPGMTPTRLAAILAARGVLGILLCPQPRPETNLEFPWQNFSAVTFGYSLASPRLHTVSATQYRAMRLTVHELRRLGYRRIGLALDGDHDLRTDHNYLAGYLVEEHLAGTGGNPAVPKLATPYPDQGAIARWLKAHRPDAIVTGNYHFLDVLRALGRKVPEQIGVACPLLPSPDTELAGVIENSVEIGSVAVDFLIGMIHRQERGVPVNPQRVHVEGRWLPGKTLRPQLH